MRGAGACLAALVALGVASAACTSSSTGGSTASSAAGPAVSVTSSADVDYSGLLIGTGDIPIVGIVLKGSQPLPGGQGVVGEFATPDGTQVLGDTVAVFDSAASAQSALQAAQASIGAQIDGVTTTSLPVADAKEYSGRQGAAAVTYVLFEQGRAFVSLAFTTTAATSVAPDVVNAVVTAQVSAITSGLH